MAGEARYASGHAATCKTASGESTARESTAGQSTAWTRTAESGNALTFHFCPVCGSTVYWEGQGFTGYLAVAIGTFADPSFPAPTVSVWEEARHPWVSAPSGSATKRVAKQG